MKYEEISPPKTIVLTASYVHAFTSKKNEFQGHPRSVVAHNLVSTFTIFINTLFALHSNFCHNLGIHPMSLDMIPAESLVVENNAAKPGRRETHQTLLDYRLQISMKQSYFPSFYILVFDIFVHFQVLLHEGRSTRYKHVLIFKTINLMNLNFIYRKKTIVTGQIRSLKPFWVNEAEDCYTVGSLNIV